MKKLSLKINIMLIFLILCFTQLNAQEVIFKSGNFLSDLSLGAIIAGAVLIYETVVRIVPTVQNVSLLNSIFSWLKKLSETLNVKKKAG